MTRPIDQRITDLIRERTGKDFTDETPMTEVMPDSLDLCELVMDIEEIIGADINDDDVEACQTVGDVVKLGRG